MKLVDANILIYSVNRDAPQHAAAKAWLEAAIASRETVGLPWIVLLAFLRLTTRQGLFQTPLSVHAALDLVDTWLEQPSVTVVHPGPRHARMLRDLLLSCGTGGNLTSDAQLAAIALEHGAELCSADHDFARFKSLKWHNPLELKPDRKRLQ
jgi:toxin-antitoxin system PIN domain toxin